MAVSTFMAAINMADRKYDDHELFALVDVHKQCTAKGVVRAVAQPVAKCTEIKLQ